MNKAYPFTLTLISFLTTMILSSCGGKTPKVDPTTEVLQKSKEEIQVSAYNRDYTEPTSFQQGVGMHARADKSEIILSVYNRDQPSVTIELGDLALVQPGDPSQSLYKLGEQNAYRSKFNSPMILRQGEKSSRRILILQSMPLSGKRLIYNNPRERILIAVPIQ